MKFAEKWASLLCMDGDIVVHMTLKGQIVYDSGSHN